MCTHTLTVSLLSTSLPNQYTKCLPALQNEIHQHSQLLGAAGNVCDSERLWHDWRIPGDGTAITVVYDDAMVAFEQPPHNVINIDVHVPVT